MTYVETELATYMELAMGGGRTCGVCFVDAAARKGALTEGRSYVDRAAIEIGLLPSGSNFVSRLVAASSRKERGPAHASVPISARLLGFSQGSDSGGRGFITSTDDGRTRRERPRDARRYDGLVQALGAEHGDLARLAYALLVDTLSSGDVLVHDDVALRVPCTLHHGTAPDLYVWDEATRYHCFSCGAGGDELDWLVRRHGLSASEAAAVLGGRS